MPKKLIKKKLKPFPHPIPLKKLLGPSFIILALGLGSGEIILWPYLVSNYGLGIAWGAILGISCQFFINMEIERYALATGESVFVGLNKIYRWTAYWFIVSTFIGFGLPGIVAASAQIFSHALGIEDFKYIAILFLIIIGIILSVGKTIYGIMEKLTQIIILTGVPLIFLLAIYLATKTDWSALALGIIGIGDEFYFLPSGIALATFFGAFAYSGAGGNLNLTQSIYIKEKGYGMGKYSQKIIGLFRNKDKNQNKEISLNGHDFAITAQNLRHFKTWWRIINLEHFFVFWLIGSLSMIFLMLLAHSTTYGALNNSAGIKFILYEGSIIGNNLFPLAGSLFLIVLALMLFQTQLGIMDSTSRIMAENFALKKINKSGSEKINLSKIYFSFLWVQIVFGITLFILNIYEPKFLITLGAVINAVTMFVHIGLIFILNNTRLPRALQTIWWRKITIMLIFIFFGTFSALVILDKLF